MNKSRYVIGLFILIGIIFQYTLFYSFEKGYSMSEKNYPLITLTLDIKHEISNSHIWLEEVLFGDTNESIDNVIVSIDNAMHYAFVMLNGGQIDNLTFSATTDKVIRKKIELLISQLIKYKDISMHRYQQSSNAHAGTQLDKEFDKFYFNVLDDANELVSNVNEIIKDDLLEYKKLEKILILSFTVLITIIVFLIYFNNKMIQKREKELIDQKKLLHMGELISNIAHHWRQPLNSVGLIIQKLKFYFDQDQLTAQTLDNSIDRAMQLINTMSKTIDDFSHFFSINKKKENFLLKDVITEAYSTQKDAYLRNNIDFKYSVENDDLSLYGYKNELTQIIEKFLNNAKDIFIENKKELALVTVKVSKNRRMIIIKTCDNGGGISNDVIEKIFYPYFSTKVSSSTTGISLYMSKRIIEDQMAGKLSVSNEESGACFTIELPANDAKNISN